MIEKLKLEPYIKESLVTHLYEKDGALIAERYDTVYWAQDSFLNVGCSKDLNCYVDAKIFNTLSSSIKEVCAKDKVLKLTLFNGAKYDLDMVEGSLPTFEFPELPNKSVFNFGGVEKAVSNSPLQKELNTVFADELGIVASNSIVGAVSGTTFKCSEAIAIPEGLHNMLNGEEIEWGIVDNKIYLKFSCYKIVVALSKLPNTPDMAWWTAVRSVFTELPDFVSVSGLKSSVSRLSNFGTNVYIKDNKLEVNAEHWEPFVLSGSGEVFDISNLNQILTDDTVGVALYGGNFFMKTKDALFVCCSIDVSGN